MDTNRQFKGIWIPKEIWLTENLNIQEKIILVEIDSLETQDKGCYASNKYFSDFFKLSTQRVSQIIQTLNEKGYIKIDYIKDGKAIKERQIRISKPPYPEVSNIFDRGIKYSRGGYQENFKENNINNNINNMNIIYNWDDNEICDYYTKNNTKCSRRSTYKMNGVNYCNQHSKIIFSKMMGQTKTNFIKPTIEEIQSYIDENNFHNIDAERFYDYYESNGWKINKTSMKDWKATIRNWNRNNADKKPKYNDGTFKVDRSRIINP